MRWRSELNARGNVCPRQVVGAARSGGALDAMTEAGSEARAGWAATPAALAATDPVDSAMPSAIGASVRLASVACPPGAELSRLECSARWRDGVAAMG